MLWSAQHNFPLKMTNWTALTKYYKRTFAKINENEGFSIKFIQLDITLCEYLLIAST